MDWLDLLNKFFQTIFFIIASIIAILTYGQAKKTWFQPMRAEIFKEQLQALTQLGSKFIGKEEGELRDNLDFDAVIRANIFKLLDAYMQVYFDVEIDPDKRPYNTKDCPIWIIPTEHLVALDHAVILDSINQEKKSVNLTKSEIWAAYDHRDICLTKVHSDAMRELRASSQSALIPKQCQILVADYIHNIDDNLYLLIDVLTEIAKELPGTYLDMESLSKFDDHWIYNRYNGKFKMLEPLARHIEVFLRSYLGTDKLLSK